MNTVTASFNITVTQMTKMSHQKMAEMSQRKKQPETHSLLLYDCRQANCERNVVRLAKHFYRRFQYICFQNILLFYFFTVRSMEI